MGRSFRDPSGQLEDDGQRIVRHVHVHSRETTQALLESPLYSDLVASGQLIGCLRCDPDGHGGLLIEHPRLALPTYPFEWTPGMLADAALLTLDIQARAWTQGWTLKDAAANNVLFDAAQPKFCDLLSLRRRQPGDAPGWEAYGQFVRHFILPLLAIAEQGRTPRDIFLAHRDGLRAAELAPFLPWHAQFGLSMWLHVRLPAGLEHKRIASKADTKESQNAARTGRADSTPWLLSNLRGFVKRLARSCRATSTWSEYTGNREHYGNAELQAKRAAVQALMSERRFQRVLDVGANSGEFSMLAAQGGADVLALDDDINALDDLYRHTHSHGVSIQCLHANIARPTPATGWRLAETLALPSRLRQRFDLILMLAVVHHLAVTERLPLPQLFETLANYCNDTLLIEFVPRDDPRFIEIAAGNTGLYTDWNLQSFLAAAEPWFTLESTTPVSSQRSLLRMKRR